MGTPSARAPLRLTAKSPKVGAATAPGAPAFSRRSASAAPPTADSTDPPTANRSAPRRSAPASSLGRWPSCSCSRIISLDLDTLLARLGWLTASTISATSWPVLAAPSHSRARHAVLGIGFVRRQTKATGARDDDGCSLRLVGDTLIASVMVCPSTRSCAAPRPPGPQREFKRSHGLDPTETIGRTPCSKHPL